MGQIRDSPSCFVAGLSLNRDGHTATGAIPSAEGIATRRGMASSLLRAIPPFLRTRCAEEGLCPFTHRETHLYLPAVVSLGVRSQFLDGLTPTDRDTILAAATRRRFFANFVITNQRTQYERALQTHEFAVSHPPVTPHHVSRGGLLAPAVQTASVFPLFLVG